MGEVWKAWDARLCRPVAIKFLSNLLVADETARQRFRREVLAASSLNHPHILTVYDCGEQDGRPYLVTELVEGRSLREHLDGGALCVPQCLDWLRQLLTGLEVAHDSGILHRDLKPENIIIRHDGYLKIVDFGLAKLFHDRQDSLTGAQILGTIQYLAPEQMRGEVLDGRVDLFAVAALAYEMFTGRQAFSGKTMPEVLSAILMKDPELPNSPLGAWLRHGLMKNRTQRFSTAQEMRDALPQGTQQTPAAVPAPAGPKDACLLILPFDARDEDRELADGLVDELILRMGRVSGLRVITRSTAQRYKGVDPHVAGVQLHARWVLEGVLRIHDSRLRLTVTLGESEQGLQVWSQRVDTEMKDVFTLEDELTETIVRSLMETELVTESAQRVLSTIALDSYNLGLALIEQGLWSQALPALRATVAEHPDFAPGLARLSQCLAMIAFLDPAQRPTASAEAHLIALRALKLEPEQPEAMLALTMLASQPL